MYIDKEKLVSSFEGLEESLKEHSLPRWEDFPDIELYMDQVISLIGKYLEIYYSAVGTEKFITPSMINNYVKLGIIPPPEKKKYSRKHLAYLIVVFTLKQTLDMATISKIIPLNTKEEQVRDIYNAFAENQHKAAVYVTETVRNLAKSALVDEEGSQNALSDLLMQVSLSANIFKILTENITRNAGTEAENA